MDDERATRREPVVHAEELVVSYGGAFGRLPGSRRSEALRGVSIGVGAGEVVALVGPNGAGKTTLFRTLLGFMRPEAGQCLLGGEEPAKYRRGRGVGYVPEAVALPRGWTARDVLCRAVDLSVPLEDRETAYAQCVARAGLEAGAAELRRKAAKCSNGMQRRLWLAGALAGDPQIVLLDEPFAGLDPPARRRLRSEVRAAKERGAAVLVASHELSEAARVADRIVLLKEGVATAASAFSPPDSGAVAAMEAAIFGESGETTDQCAH